jgi:preprotein translocase subunit SecE
MKRFPKKQEIIKSFLTVLTVVNFWAMIVYLYNFPGLVKQLMISNLLAVLGYVLFSALVESLIICLVLLILSILLPAKILRTDFAERTLVLLLLTAIYIYPFHVTVPPISTLILETVIVVFIALWSGLYITELVLFHLAIAKHPKFTAKLRMVVDKVTVLGAIYLFLDLIASGFVIIINWS